MHQVQHLGRGADNEINKKWYRKEDVLSKKWCASQKFFCAIFSVTQSLFLFGFSWGSDNITASNRKEHILEKYLPLYLK